MNPKSAKPAGELTPVKDENREISSTGREADVMVPKGNTASETDDEGPALSKAIQDHLGRRLKATYVDLVSQPVPDRFRLLLEELERREKKQ